MTSQKKAADAPNKILDPVTRKPMTSQKRQDAPNEIIDPVTENK